MPQLNVTAVRIVTSNASRIWQKQEQRAALRGHCVSAGRAYVVLRGLERYGCPTKTLPIRKRFPPTPTAVSEQTLTYTSHITSTRPLQVAHPHIRLSLHFRPADCTAEYLYDFELKVQVHQHNYNSRNLAANGVSALQRPNN